MKAGMRSPDDGLPDVIELHPDAEYVTGYDDGWEDRDHLSPVDFRGFGLGILVGMICGVALALSSMPK